MVWNSCSPVTAASFLSLSLFSLSVRENLELNFLFNNTNDTGNNNNDNNNDNSQPEQLQKGFSFRVTTFLFYQPIGEKHKCTNTGSLAQSVSPTKIC